MADNRYRLHINTISITGFVDLAISWHPQVRRYRVAATVTRMHTGQHAAH